MQALTTAQPDGTLDRRRVAPVVVGCLAAALALVIAGYPIGAVLVVSLVFAAAAAGADAQTARLPNELVGLTAMGPVAFAALQVAVDGFGVLAAVVGGATLGAVPVLVLHLSNPAAMGFGDVKFAAAIGANLGLLDARSILVALCIASVIAVVTGAASRRATIPFGPPLLAGALLSASLFFLVERVA